MHAFIKRALWGTLFAGGITLLGATAANAAEPPPEPGPVSSLLGDNGLVDSLVGDTVVEPVLGDAGAIAPVTSAVAGIVDEVTNSTAGTELVGALTGGGSALNDVVGDGALVEGGTVGDLATNVDAVLDDVGAGDLDAALDDVGTTVEDLGTALDETVTDAATNVDDQIIDGLVADALTDLGDVLDGGDTPAEIYNMLQRLGANVADTTDTTGLLEDALTTTLEEANAPDHGGATDDADGLLTGLTENDGLVDGLVGDSVLDPILGEDGALEPVTDAVAGLIDDVTGTTAGTTIVDSLVGPDSGLNDVVGDGILVEGGLVGDLVDNGDAVLDELGEGDLSGVVDDLGTTVSDLGDDLGRTLFNATANTSNQIVDGLVNDALADAGALVDALATGGDVPTALASTVQNAGANIGDAIDSTGLLQQALVDVLGDADPGDGPDTPGGPGTPGDPGDPPGGTTPGDPGPGGTPAGLGSAAAFDGVTDLAATGGTGALGALLMGLLLLAAGGVLVSRRRSA